MKQSMQSESVQQHKPMVEEENFSSSLAQAMFIDNRPQAVTQRRLNTMASEASSVTVQRQSNSTSQGGLPHELRQGIEALSGMSMEHVQVHYNSSQPAQLNAHAYAQGSEIYLAPGQERHLPHEAWHVVQQAQGRVAPTMQMKEDTPINDDRTLEEEADLMGNRALAHGQSIAQRLTISPTGDSINTSSNGIATPARAVGQRQSRVVQKLDYGALSGTQSAQVNAVAEGIYYQFAPEFETAIGRAAFRNADAINAARITANNFSTVLGAYASTRQRRHGENDQQKEDRYLSQVLGNHDRDAAGSIGAEAGQIRAALAGGNLREHLTLLYGTVSSGDFGRVVRSLIADANVQHALRQVIGDNPGNQFVQHLTNTATALNVANPATAASAAFVPFADNTVTDTRGVQEEQTRDLPPRYRPDGFDAYGNPMMVQIDYATFQPIPATRQTMHDNMNEETANAVDSRVRRHGGDRQTTDSAQDLANKGAALSNRELIHQYLSRDPVTRDNQLNEELYRARVTNTRHPNQANVFWGWNAQQQQQFLLARFGNQALSWEPGDKVFDLVPDATFTEQMDRAKVLIKATASSSTDLVMKIGRYMYGSGPAQLLGMRAAALGWMLPVGDHSYWEILLAASRSGTPAPANGPAVYDEHAPMSQNDIGEDSPNLLMQAGFRNTLSHILFQDNAHQRQTGLNAELNNLFPRSNATIRRRINTVVGNFKATRTDAEIDRIVNAVRAPRSVVERIVDPAVLNSLWNFIHQNRIATYAGMDAVRANSGTYREVRRTIGSNGADILFAAIFEEDGNNRSDETRYLDRVAHFLSGNNVNNPGTGLGFSAQELQDAQDIPQDLGADYGQYDRGRRLSPADFNNLRGEEILALREYTGNASTAWNSLMSRPRDRLGEVGANSLNNDLEDIAAGISGVQNLPVYNQGRVYRGESGDIDDYRVGDVVNFQKFLSTGKSYEDSFAPGAEITIIIDNIRTGVDVQLLSNQDQEREVLFPPYARFVVTRVEDRRRAGGTYGGVWVYMNEI